MLDVRDMLLMKCFKCVNIMYEYRKENYLIIFYVGYLY